jgi:hypothetical protein
MRSKYYSGDLEEMCKREDNAKVNLKRNKA